jgi:hypothetical protein
VIEKSHMSCCTCHISHVIFVGCSKNRALAWGGGGEPGWWVGAGWGQAPGAHISFKDEECRYIYIYIYMGMISSQNVSKECCTISKSMPEHLKPLPVHYSFPCQNGLKNKLQT